MDTTTATARNLPDYVTQGEARTAAALVNGLTAAGYLLSVYDGEAFTVRKSRDAVAIAAALASTGMDSLTVRREDDGARGHLERVGSILLVWGNDPAGSELVSDWSWDDLTVAGRTFNAFMEACTAR